MSETTTNTNTTPEQDEFAIRMGALQHAFRQLLNTDDRPQILRLHAAVHGMLRDIELRANLMQSSKQGTAEDAAT